MADFELSVTICSWNTVEDLRACLASLRSVREEADFEVIVVDNASEDGSPDMVEEEFPEVRLLRQTQNLGFTGGHNLAIRERRGHHAALLNSDTVVHEGAIARLMKHLRSDSKIGIVGPKLLNPDGSLQLSARRFPNPIAAAFRNTFLGRLFPNNRYARDYLMLDFDHSETRSVDWVSGAAMFVRKELIDETQGLDPSYFMYLEDVDWCWRAWRAGYEVVYLPDAVVTHAIGRSTDRVANKMIVRHHRSMFKFWMKRIVPDQPLLLRPLMVVFAATALPTRACLFLAKNAFDEVRRRLSR